MPSAPVKVYDDEVDEGNDMPKLKGKVEVKLYPSSIVKDTTVSTGERSTWSPQQLRQLARNFKELDENDRPYIVVEHSVNEKDRLGRVTGMTYNEVDGWLWVEGRIKEDKKRQFEDAHVYNDGKKGVSLCYVIGKDYKGFLEFSFVKKPDFENASLVRYHSESGLLATIHCLGPEDVPAELNSARKRMSEHQPVVEDDDNQPSGGLEDYSTKYMEDNGEYVISSHEHFEGVRAHLLKLGVENPKITVANVGFINSLPEHQRDLFIAGLMSREEKRTEDANRAEADAAYKKEVAEAMNLTLSIAESNPLLADDATKRQLGEVIMTNKAGRLVAQAATHALAQRDKEIADRVAEIDALKKQLEKKERTTVALRERTQILAHAAQAPMTDFQKCWNECMARAEKQGVPPLSVTTSSTSSSSSLKASLDAGATIKSHSASAKRVRSDRDESREKAIALHKQSTWMGVSLHPHPDDTVKIVQHSASDDSTRAHVVDRTKVPSDLEHSIGLYRELVSGRRKAGYDRVKRNRTNALGNVCPTMMLALMHATNGPVECNGEAGIYGFEDKLPEGFADDVKHLLPFFEHSRKSKYTSRRVTAEDMFSPSIDMPGRAY